MPEKAFLYALPYEYYIKFENMVSTGLPTNMLQTKQQNS